MESHLAHNQKFPGSKPGDDIKHPSAFWYFFWKKEKRKGEDFPFLFALFIHKDSDRAVWKLYGSMRTDVNNMLQHTVIPRRRWRNKKDKTIDKKVYAFLQHLTNKHADWRKWHLTTTQDTYRTTENMSTQTKTHMVAEIIHERKTTGGYKQLQTVFWKK